MRIRSPSRSPSATTRATRSSRSACRLVSGTTLAREMFTSGVDNAGWGLGSNRAIRTGQSLDPPAGSDETVWFNPAAFAVNPNGSFGDTLRGEFFGPSRTTVDMGLFKRFRFSNEMNLQFRAEFFNLFNTVNFSNPNTTVNTAATFGRITGVQDPRIMQFGLKFLF